MAAKRATTRVLLVDDESLVRRILKQILASYQDMELVGEAANGEEAVAAVARLQPDIVLMDIRMPAVDGIAAAREIRLKYPHVKIIGLSEYGNDYNADAMERAGAVRGISQIDGVGGTLSSNQSGPSRSLSRRAYGANA